jgi:hypothetical protein
MSDNTYTLDFDLLGSEDMFDEVPGLEDQDPTELSDSEAVNLWLKAYGLIQAGVELVKIDNTGYSPAVTLIIPTDAVTAFEQAYGMPLDEAAS